MATPDLGGRGDCVVSVEFDPVGAAGTYTKWCGAKNFSFGVNNEFSEEKVGDCDDWTAPVVTISVPNGQTVSASMDATWVAAYHLQTSDWVLNQKALLLRIEFPNAAVGQVQYYDVTAYIEGLDLGNIGNTEGGVITENVTLKVTGGVTRTLRAA